LSRDTSFENLYSHMSYHDVKGWLIKGAKHEDAQTILAALARISSRRLRKGLAKVLADA
jgi:predicted amidophosphoribosyltransferase